ncbi:PepSY domain-containing protein [Priestia aryabhattai]|uniref:PepSY domain-containing protein n=1 Tax=Priestia aryabhattai TaxID=412384 RepID=UPI00203CAD37|nr:PepSY domain-containing protein [Priestia aryabhattai]MCM3772975.1 PepSY domain-containing protein [Priestia aryabhattai]
MIKWTKILSTSALGTAIAFGSITTSHAAEMKTAKAGTIEHVSISQAQAKGIALQDCKGTVTSTEFKQESSVYVITIVTNNLEQRIVEVSASTGKVVKKQEVKLWTQNQVKESVSKQYKGAIQSITFNKETREYKIIVVDGKVEYTLTVDGLTGKVIHENKKELQPISEQKIKEAAAKQYSGYVYSLEFKEANNQYVAVILKDSTQYTVTLDALTGKVVNTSKQAVKLLTRQDAKDLALATYAGNVRMVEYDQNAAIFTVKVIKDNTEYTVTIDAVSGKITHIKQDKLQPLTENAVKALALKHQEGKVEHVELTTENSITVYVVTVINGSKQQKLKFDAYTGQECS